MNEKMITFLIMIAVFSIMGGIYIVSSFRKKRNPPEDLPYRSRLTPGAQVHPPRRRRQSMGVWIFLLFFGLLLTCIGSAGILSMQHRTKDWAKVPAVISYFDITRRPKTHMTVKVDYVYKGTEYSEVPLKYKSSRMREGQRVTVMVNPSRPSEIEYDIKAMSRFYSVFILVGGVMSLSAIHQCVMCWRGKSTWRTEGDPPVVLSPEEEKREQMKGKIFAGLVAAFIFAIFYFAAPRPIFLIMAAAFLFSYLRGKYLKWKKKLDEEF